MTPPSEQTRPFPIALIAILGFIILALIALLILLLTAPANPRPPVSTPQVIPSRVPTGTAPTPPPADDTWARVQAAGKLVVGTSADYPPFAYYTDQFRVDGFDVQLMRDIGQKLGVQVVFNDFAFDGLPAAVQVAQIDAAIAAISIDPQRSAVVDFTNVYYVGGDALLARPDATLTVASVNDLLGQRVGVQRGSVYESWLKDQLPPNSLFAYQRATDAVNDLKANRVDVVMMDALPAQEIVRDGSTKIIGERLNQQLLGIAIRKGASSLKTQLDNALLQLQNEGRIAQLSRQYFNTEPLPLPTPQPPIVPTATPVPVGPTATPTCLNSLAFVQDLNYDDRNMTAPPAVKPGQPFSKGWRVLNNGTCTWNTGYRLQFVQGNTPQAGMGGQPVYVQGSVPPGAVYDFYANLVAPINPGIYQGFWQIFSDLGLGFGQRVYVGIQVLPFATITPMPTQTPSADIIFTADRTAITGGQPVNFSWRVQNVKAVYFYRDGDDWRNNGVAGTGTRTEYPQTTTIYNLRVLRLDNTYDVRSIRIDVSQPVGPPQITRFTVTPPDQITQGQCVIVQWEVQGQASRVTLTFASQTWDNAPASGSRQDCPTNPGVALYSIVATGPGGTNQAQQYVNVVTAATATPMPTPPPENPVVYSFAVNPTQIQVNQCVNISWSAGGGTVAVQIKRDDAVILDGAGLTGTAQDCPTTPGTPVYRVVARNSAGVKDTRDQAITVTDVPPQNPLANTSWGVQMLSNLPIIQDSQLSLRFSSDGSLNGYGGCNNFSATYTVNGSSLRITNLLSPRLLCPDEGLMQQESDFFNALTAATSFSQFSPGSLSIDGGTSIILQQLLMQPR